MILKIRQNNNIQSQVRIMEDLTKSRQADTSAELQGHEWEIAGVYFYLHTVSSNDIHNTKYRFLVKQNHPTFSLLLGPFSNNVISISEPYPSPFSTQLWSIGSRSEGSSNKNNSMPFCYFKAALGRTNDYFTKATIRRTVSLTNDVQSSTQLPSPRQIMTSCHLGDVSFWR